MSELANLPALTADELDVLGRAVLSRLGVMGDSRSHSPSLDHERLLLMSLAVAIAEARYSLDRRP